MDRARLRWAILKKLDGHWYRQGAPFTDSNKRDNPTGEGIRKNVRKMSVFE